MSKGFFVGRTVLIDVFYLDIISDFSCGSDRIHPCFILEGFIIGVFGHFIMGEQMFGRLWGEGRVHGCAGPFIIHDMGLIRGGRRKVGGPATLLVHPVKIMEKYFPDRLHVDFIPFSLRPFRHTVVSGNGSTHQDSQNG